MALAYPLHPIETNAMHCSCLSSAADDDEKVEFLMLIALDLEFEEEASSLDERVDSDTSLAEEFFALGSPCYTTLIVCCPLNLLLSQHLLLHYMIEIDGSILHNFCLFVLIHHRLLLNSLSRCPVGRLSLTLCLLGTILPWQSGPWLRMPRLLHTRLIRCHCSSFRPTNWMIPIDNSTLLSLPRSCSPTW